MRYEYFLYNLILQLYPRANITLSFATKKIKKKKLYFVKCYPNVKLTNLKPREGRDGFFFWWGKGRKETLGYLVH